MKSWLSGWSPIRASAGKDTAAGSLAGHAGHAGALPAPPTLRSRTLMRRLLPLHVAVCHNLKQAQAGMMLHLVYDRVTSPYQTRPRKPPTAAVERALRWEDRP
jgi:hypothetical protein